MKLMGAVEGSLAAFQKIGVGAGGDDHFALVNIHHLPRLVGLSAPKKILGQGVVGNVHQVGDGKLCSQFMNFILYSHGNTTFCS